MNVNELDGAGPVLEFGEWVVSLGSSVVDEKPVGSPMLSRLRLCSFSPRCSATSSSPEERSMMLGPLEWGRGGGLRRVGWGEANGAGYRL